MTTEYKPPTPFAWNLTPDERAAAEHAVRVSKRVGLWRYEDACKAVARLRRAPRWGFTNEKVIAMEHELLAASAEGER